MNDDNVIEGYYTLAQAAAYLETSPRNVAHHIYVRRDLHPDKNFRGRQILFTQATLDAFKLRWQRRRKRAPVDLTHRSTRATITPLQEANSDEPESTE